MSVWKSIVLFLVPGALFAGACTLWLRGPIAPAWQPFLDLLPFVLAGLGLLLGWRFNRTRVIWAILLLALLDRALVLLAPFAREYVLAVAPVLLPLNLLMIGWWRERGLFTGHGLFRMALFVGQGGVLGWLFQQRAAEVLAWVASPLVRHGVLAEVPFSQLGLACIMLSLAGLLVRFWQRPEALSSSFCWVLAASVCGLYRPDQFTFWGGAAALLLIVAVIESGFSMAFNDELTGLPARRAMNEFLLKMSGRYTVAMVDVDHFKKVNDTYGHDVGDQVLRMVAGCLRAVTGSGRVFRYGGEEFAVIFPGKDVERALPHLEILRERIARSGFVLRGKDRPKTKPAKPRKSSTPKTLQVTASFGVAACNEHNPTAESVLKAADQALYKAKKTGRNKICS